MDAKKKENVVEYIIYLEWLNGWNFGLRNAYW